jgi:hypothetical protein
MKKKYFQEKIGGVTSFATTSWAWFNRMNQILGGTSKANGTPNGLGRVMLMLDLCKHQTLKKIY